MPKGLNIVSCCSWYSDMSNPIPPEYFKAGSIASRVRESIRKSVTSDARIIDICEEVESMIGDLGGKPAFPCNVCINDIAAHYTAEPADKGRLHDNDIVKIDIGVHVEGYVADTATTVSFDPRFVDLLDATEVTLNEALSTAKEGVRLGEIGRIVSDCSKRRGFRPIVNLSGHSLDRYKIHAGKSIPNSWVPGSVQFTHGEVYAIEPFLTLLDGAGLVMEGSKTTIFSMITRKRTGDKDLDRLCDTIWSRYRTLPFAIRWLNDVLEPVDARSLIYKLIKHKIVRGYAVLVEEKGRPVAQFEHTVVLAEDGTKIITK